MTAHVGVQGFVPQVVVRNREAAKYERLWAMPEYRAVAPGEQLADLFLRVVQPRRGAEVIDFGCGTGRGALMLAILGGLRVTMVDFASNCLDPEIQEALTTQGEALRFIQADLLHAPLPVAAQYGYCTDVLEHLPAAKIDAALDNILQSAQHVFFSISTVPDHCGDLIGETLHLTVRPYAWWLEQFARREAVVHWSKDAGGACLFYVTAWTSGKDISVAGVINTEESEIRQHVEHNIAQGWRQVEPHLTNDMEVAILGGGPSLAQFEDEIRAQKARGVKIVTLNGTYAWAKERELWPVTQIIVDAREFNQRFVHPVDERNLYLVASQCHPAVLEGLPRDRTYLWHTAPQVVSDLLNTQYPEGWHAIPGGSTVLLRAIPLLRFLGYTKFHLYGCDSCVDTQRAHHAYAQPENDHLLLLPVTLHGRMFWANTWMISQAQEFIELIRSMGDVVDLAVYGDGLLAHILNTGAELAALEGLED